VRAHTDGSARNDGAARNDTVLAFAKTARVRFAQRSVRSWRTHLGLTLASALVAHVAFDAVASGAAAIVSRPIHALYFVIVLGALAGARAELFHPDAAERRRRSALFRNALTGPGYAWVALTVGLQIVLAGGSLALEGEPADGSHVLAALLSALFAILVGALALRSVHRRLLQLAAAWFASREPARTRFARLVPRAGLASAAEPYTLFRPNRPPPVLA
jgi:hypothetical protein